MYPVLGSRGQSGLTAGTAELWPGVLPCIAAEQSGSPQESVRLLVKGCRIR